MPLISVIIPTWNRSTSLIRAIRSVLNQTISDFEILVCDDGSTDDSCAMIKELNDPRVQWISGLHSGLPAVPRNRGIKLASGDWVAFLDSDDEWMPNKIERQLAFARQYNYEAVSSNAIRIDTSGRQLGLIVNILGSELRLKCLVRNNDVVTSTMMVKRQILQSCNGFPEDVGLKALEDYALWLRVAEQGAIGFTDAPLVSYIDAPQASVRWFSLSPRRQRARVLLNFMVFSKELGPYRSLKVALMVAYSIVYYEINNLIFLFKKLIKNFSA